MNQQYTPMFRKFSLLISLFFFLLTGAEGKPPDIDPQKTLLKVREIMKDHASYNELTPELLKRVIQLYIEQLDPSKTYFIHSDLQPWVEANDSFLKRALDAYSRADFTLFMEIHEKMIKAIERRRRLDQKIDLAHLPKNVDPKEFKEMKWAANEEELVARLERIKALQVETSTKLNEELKEKSLQRLKKHQDKFENEIIASDSRLILSNILKATASALDSHTAYFTPAEATQFMINVQQRLFGIGAQLRDDLNGFTVVKIIEGGPAAASNELKVKDRIVAIDHEPVVGMDIVDAVELIRGQEGTPLILTIIRETGEGENKKEEQHDIKIVRGEVVLKETRYESSYEYFGDGVIGYFKLFSFYQDPDSSSTADLSKAIEKLKSEHPVKGIILDLRYNSGGMLTQAVGVSGLFISKGVVVGIKDHTNSVQYLRDLDGKKVWDGPLIILVNRASASASEIVAQALQDYGRAIIVGDDHTYGKGSFQTFTLNAGKEGTVNPEGEYKVTRGRYYTVSGKTPQLTGVTTDITLPGPLSELDVGEKFAKFPLENDSIKPNFDDDLSDIPFAKRQQVRLIYKFGLQPQLTIYQPYMERLKKNSEHRIANNKNYQAFLKEVKKENRLEGETEEQFGQNDLQLAEAYNIMKDLILMMDTAKTR